MMNDDDTQGHFVWQDSYFYGEITDSLDCPEDGGFCTNYEKRGLTFFTASFNEEKDIIIVNPSNYPCGYMIHGSSSWDILAEINECTFSDFSTYTVGGMR